MRDTGPPASAEENAAHRALARLVFFTFLLTFISARILVILMMSRRLPDFFLHIGGTHIHHLNYGIFLLCATGGLSAVRASHRRQITHGRRFVCNGFGAHL